MAPAGEQGEHYTVAENSSRWGSAESAGWMMQSMIVHSDCSRTLSTAATVEGELVSLGNSPDYNLQDYMAGDSKMSSHYRMQLDGMPELAIAIAFSQMLADCKMAAAAGEFEILGTGAGNQTKLDSYSQMSYVLEMEQ